MSRLIFNERERANPHGGNGCEIQMRPASKSSALKPHYADTYGGTDRTHQAAPQAGLKGPEPHFALNSSPFVSQRLCKTLHIITRDSNLSILQSLHFNMHLHLPSSLPIVLPKTALAMQVFCLYKGCWCANGLLPGKGFIQQFCSG